MYSYRVHTFFIGAKLIHKNILKDENKRYRNRINKKIFLALMWIPEKIWKISVIFLNKFSVIFYIFIRVKAIFCDAVTDGLTRGRAMNIHLVICYSFTHRIVCTLVKNVRERNEIFLPLSFQWTATHDMCTIIFLCGKNWKRSIELFDNFQHFPFNIFKKGCFI